MAKSAAVKMTEARLRSEANARAKKELRDQDCLGLLIRVQKTGGVTFAWTGRNTAGKQQTRKIGSYPEMSLKAARDQITLIRIAMRSGDMSLIESFSGARERPKQSVIAGAAVVANDAVVSLGTLLVEFEVANAAKLSSWRPRRKEAAKAFREHRLNQHLEALEDELAQHKERRSNARAVIESVFASLLPRYVTQISDEDLCEAIASYERKRRRWLDPDAPMTAGGQVSRARAYLGTVLNWAGGRRKFRQLGRHRKVKLAVTDMRNVYDPAVDDEFIHGERSRVLSHAEIRRILPLLVYPTPEPLRSKKLGAEDMRPAALAFQFREMSRIGEVLATRWSDIDLIEKTWTKRVKSRGSQRVVTVPLSAGAIVILKSLPSFQNRENGGLVFENAGKPIINWRNFMLTLRKVTDIHDIISHDFRRSSATIARRLGVSLDIIATGLGHKNPVAEHCASASTGTYARLGDFTSLSEDPLRVAFDKVDQAIEFLMMVGPKASNYASQEAERSDKYELMVAHSHASGL